MDTGLVNPYYCHNCGAAVGAAGETCGSCGVDRRDEGWPLDARIDDGERFGGRYVPVRRLGGGAFAVVYLADEVELGPGVRQCAVKVLHRVPNNDARARFERERKLLATLGTKRIASIYGAGVTDSGVPWIAQEFVAGETLRAMLDRDERLGVEVALHVAREVAAALVDLHEAGILHRDLKPANIMITTSAMARPRVRLIDLGLALVPDEPRETLDGRVAGTPLYMAPEQIDGNPEPRSDLFAMGAVLYECLTGCSPFMPGDPEPTRVVLERIASGPREPPSRRRPGLPEGVDGLVLDLLAIAPGARPKDASTALARIEEILNLVGGGPPPAPPRTPFPTRRAMGLGAAALAALGSAGVAWRLSGPGESVRVEVRATAVRLGAEGPLHPNDTLTTELDSFRFHFRTEHELYVHVVDLRPDGTFAQPFPALGEEGRVEAGVSRVPQSENLAFDGDAGLVHLYMILSQVPLSLADPELAEQLEAIQREGRIERPTLADRPDPDAWPIARSRGVVRVKDPTLTTYELEVPPTGSRLLYFPLNHRPRER